MDTMPEMKLPAKEELLPLASLVRTLVDSQLSVDASFERREAGYLAVSNEVTRLALESDLQSMADRHEKELLVDGERYRRHEFGTLDYHSLCGPLTVHRATYRQVGDRNGPTVVPLELEAGLVEGATPALAFDVMQGYAKQDLRSHVEDLVTAHRLPPSRSTLERMAQRIGDVARTHAPRIEAYVRRDELLPEGAAAVSTGLDRVAVPMEEPRPADAPPKLVKRKKPRVRKAPAPVDVNYRMAYTGTVAILNALGETLATRKYAIPAGDDAADLVARMTADVRTLVRKKPTLTVGIVQDGALEMWNLMRAGLQSIEGVKVEEAIDRCHLMERLGKALALVEPNAEVRSALLKQWDTEFEYRDSTIDSVEHYLIKRHGEVPAEHAEDYWDHLTYIRRNKDRMRYVTVRLAGLPVGSGVTEGSCKSVVAKRARGGGQRWHERGLRNVLFLRALHQSERLPRYWSHLAHRYSAKVVNE